MRIKIERRIFNITNKDIVFDNGACYQLISQTYRQKFAEYYPVMSRTQFNRLISNEALVLVSETTAGRTSAGDPIIYRKYRFQISNIPPKMEVKD